MLRTVEAAKPPLRRAMVWNSSNCVDVLLCDGRENWWGEEN